MFCFIDTDFSRRYSFEVIVDLIQCLTKLTKTNPNSKLSSQPPNRFNPSNLNPVDFKLLGTR